MKLGNVESEFLQIVCGVPQGSTLGPLLFLLYKNDLANSSDMLSFRLFADDANIFYATKTSNDLEADMNSELQKVIITIAISISCLLTEENKFYNNISTEANYTQCQYLKH